MAIGEDTRRQRDLRTVPAQGALDEQSRVPSSPEKTPSSDPQHPDRVVLTDRHWPGRSYDTVDRIVIAPTGIFVIDVVGWSGPVEVTPDVLEVNGRGRHTAVTSAQDTAREVALLLAPDMRDHVFPVICFSRDEELNGWVKAVRVCSSATINGLIETRDTVLTDHDVVQISSELDAALLSNQASPDERSRATDPGATRRSAGRDSDVAEARVSWRRSRMGRITQGALGLGVVGAIAFAGLHLTTFHTTSDDTPQQHRPAGHSSAN